ncbi:hypothetical protein, partial [Streptococcus pneumoniae]|uniref:hypothetical protein n=1 Tax=Streptococcus pneumoniae TaxID=1313 RepID=UPI001C9349E3
PLGEKRNHPGSKLRQGFWMVFRLGVNNWGVIIQATFLQSILLYITIDWSTIDKSMDRRKK